MAPLRWSGIVLALVPCLLAAQDLRISFTVDPSRDTLAISPFIYGTNGQSSDWEANITARRLGGNRMTGYNWENNASNMGTDYNGSNANDDYMTWSAGIPESMANIPGITLTAFHDTSLAMSCYSLITLPAAGYVSRDKNGPVSAADSAPSPRWRKVATMKPSPLATAPDTSDGFVYVNEEVNFLVAAYGPAGSGRGVRGYEVDNEPALWPYTHPRIHPRQTTGWEVIAKNVAVARAVKSVDPQAEVFGGVFYGFNELYNMQNAPDNADFQSYGTYLNAFLARMKDSSAAAGKRLLDVMDLHWYPDLYVPITQNDNVDTLTVETRVQAPRSLWDSIYVENGWIGQWYSPVSLIPNTKTGIARYYPGTRLGITEFNYGAPKHVSGGVALADVLGIFGRYGVYFASHWGAVTDYLQSAYEMYRNYDGAGGTFGDVSVRATTSDIANSSIHASLHRDRAGVLDLILINKNLYRPISAAVAIAGSFAYLSAAVLSFDSTSSAIHRSAPIAGIAANTFSYTLPPLSVFHFVLSGVPSSVESAPRLPGAATLEQNFPNPFNPSTEIRFTLPAMSVVSLAVFDILGRRVATLAEGTRGPGTYTARWDARGFSSGVYVCRLRAAALDRPGGGSLSRAMILVK